MKLVEPAARHRGRKSRFLLLPLLLLASLHSPTAFAASLTVKVRQLNPAGDAQQVVCAPHKKCVLPVEIQTGPTKEKLTVHVLFVPGNVLFEFETPKGYLYAADKNPADKQRVSYEAIWQGITAAVGPPSTRDVTLFLPRVPNAASAPPIFNGAQQPVADLEITVEAAP